MSRELVDFCSFCHKTQHEVDLIDTTKNLLLIDDKCYEFNAIANDLLSSTVSCKKLNTKSISQISPFLELRDWLYL
jgi:hypothetical protein